jgi:hypothetical protein
VFKVALDSRIITAVLKSDNWQNRNFPSILADPPTLNYRYQNVALSPDRQWLLYTSAEGGGGERVWVAPYPSLGSRRPVSATGGTSAVWTRDGTEIVYCERASIQTCRLLSVAFRSEGPLPPAVPVFDEGNNPIGRSGALPSFDVSPDGQRFVAVARDPSRYPPRATIDVVFNWLDTLPAKLGGSR